MRHAMESTNIYLLQRAIYERDIMWYSLHAVKIISSNLKGGMFVIYTESNQYGATKTKSKSQSMVAYKSAII